jgi:histidyl-tRNA synthetase
MSISIPPGVFDILPEESKEEWRQSHLWQYVESKIHEIARQYGFKEIRTPLFERTELFARGVGDTTDIVTKEMFTFQDKGGRSMTLRPEGTASAMRAFIENQLYNASQIHKLYYIAPMFRYERSQAGRYRQHHQFGVEAIGNEGPEQDVEVIDLIYTLFSRLGLKNLHVGLNSIGDISSRLEYRKVLCDYLRNHISQLSTDSQTRFEQNPMRVLDSKDSGDQRIVANAPSILDFLNADSKDHFEAVKGYLEKLNIPYQVNPNLVRGLDYYNKTVFEIVCKDLGAQNSLVGGGRYDGLIKTLGGPDLPAMGFGSGLERVIQTLLKQGVSLPNPVYTPLFLIALGIEPKKECFLLLHQLRLAGISAQMDFSSRKLNKIMQYANRINARFVAVIGDQELLDQVVNIKEMATGTVTQVPYKEIVSWVSSKG